MQDWMGLDPDDRTAIFIDGANLYKTARNLGFDIDYKRLLQRTREETRLVRAYYYTAMQEDRDQDYSPLRPLVDWLDYNGFQMVTKVAREYTDAQGRKRYRGSVDIELAVDMVLMAEKLDCIVLFTGNGDFRHAIEKVQQRGCRVICVSTMSTQPPMASDDIRRQADQFIDLTSLEGVIGRKSSAPRKETAASDEEDEFEDSYDGAEA
ncbi:NYN domain-containing protein [Parvularcula sp. LCG005]|uniref:LabA-like NYN domain-containing protein n=1 Tax=Parvularcula sp. LCG005 TaxID=3078805 RepID=UPI002943636E|nr:NYN domain-containing protein [Parvularcula sp. LCG005]WOI54250.1 NYN domain-containing protein [Parvularcula sp. LCG005]